MLLTSGPNEDTLDLSLCIEISNALIDIFKYVPNTLALSSPADSRLIDPIIQVDGEPRFRYDRISKNISHTLEIVNLVNMRGGSNYIRVSRSSLYRTEMRELIKTLGQMDMAFAPLQIREPLTGVDLLRRWEFMSSLRSIFPTSPTSWVPVYDPSLGTAEFQIRLLRLITLTIPHLQANSHSVDTSRLESFIARLLEFMPMDIVKLEELMSPDEDGTKEAKQYKAEEEESVDGGPLWNNNPIYESFKRFSDDRLQKLVIRLTSLAICHVRWDPHSVHAGNLGVQIEKCFQRLPDEEHSDTEMVELRVVLTKLRELIQLAARI
ncbi:hypothetical protein M422DRAFT_45216 [Sphaerobolus stellatus SS14]|nr:hypothetical protein M422DRAFT_45216 [Sphaerobolus stellatus SS14]